MNVKTMKSRVIALVMSLLVVVAFMPAIASAAVSTDLYFSAKGGSPTTAIETTVGAEKPGYIGAKALGEDLATDKVTCVSQDESIATVVDQNKTDGEGCWKFDIVGKKAGTTKITVTADDNPANTAEVTVNVAGSTSNIHLEFGWPKKINTAVGAKKGGLIAAYAAGGTEEYGKVTCESQDETIATVTATDKQMQGQWWKFDVTGLKTGTVDIIVTAVEDPEVQDVVKVTVVEDLITVEYGNLKKGFDIDEFDALPTVTVPKWGGRNHYFSFLTYPDEDQPDSEGPTVETILSAAGVDVTALKDDQLISFIPSDNPAYTATFTVGQILRTPRYFFPNSANLKNGAIATEAQLAGAVETPTMICKMDNTDSRLVLGQVFPNERSVAVSAKCMTTGGKIVISDQMATQLDNDVKASKASGSYVQSGTEIKLDSETMFTNEIYYTLDGSVPYVETAALYNYCTKGDYATAKITVPKGKGSFIVKVMQYAYGKLPSAVKTFKYTIIAKKGNTYTTGGQKYKVTKAATAKAKGTVTFTKSKSAKTVTVPQTVKLSDGKTYYVTGIGAKAFSGKKATKVIVKTKKLTKKTVKGSMKSSKVKYVVVKVGSKKQNKTYVKKYKKIFTKANAGKKVTVK